MIWSGAKMLQRLCCFLLLLGTLGLAWCAPAMAASSDTMSVDDNGYFLPPWSSVDGWDNPASYNTISTADFDGDGVKEIYSWCDRGLDVWEYVPSFGSWLPVDTGETDLFRASDGWGTARQYTTIQAADLDGDGKDEILGCSEDGIVAYRAENIYRPPSGTDIESWSWTELAPGPPWRINWGWSSPEYYSTIQTADIDGDGAQELMGRGVDGLKSYKYDGASNSWTQLATLTDLSDEQDFEYAPYYETLQFADITGNGRQELLIRASSGMYAFSYRPQETTKWAQLEISNAPFGDPRWWQSPYYGTIQCADVNGDGQAELLGRSSDGLEAYHYNLSSSAWEPYKVLADVSDHWGFNADQYDDTMRYADVDGDGAAEFMIRSSSGLSTYDLNTDSGSWIRKESALLEISDDLGWDQPQYYSTLQFVDLDNDGTGKAEMLIRGTGGVRGYRMTSGASPTWTSAEATYPDYTSDPDSEEAAAYSAIHTHLVKMGDLNESQDLRQQYASMTKDGWDDIQTHIHDMHKPDNVSDQVWKSVKTQLSQELTAVNHVAFDFTVNMQNMISQLADVNYRSIDPVADEVKAEHHSTTLYLAGQFAKDAIDIFFDLAGPAEEAKITAKVAWEMLSVAVSGALDDVKVGDASDSSVQMEVDNFKDAMNSWFLNNETLLSDNYESLSQSWGMLQAQNRMMNARPIDWKSQLQDIITGINEKYRLSLFKALMPTKYKIFVALDVDSSMITKYIGSIVNRPPEGTYLSVKLADGHYNHWAVAYRELEPVPVWHFPATSTMTTIWKTFKTSTDDFFMSKSGWGFERVTITD